jgi:hypothetical protein
MMNAAAAAVALAVVLLSSCPTFYVSLLCAAPHILRRSALSPSNHILLRTRPYRTAHKIMMLSSTKDSQKRVVFVVTNS